MQVGLPASALAHAGVLILALVSFTGAKPFEPMPESMPVDIISATDFTKLTKGAKTAPKSPTQKHLVEKVAEPTPIEDPNLKASEKPPVEATTPPPPPPPAPKVEQPKVEPKPPAPAKAEAQPKAEPKVEPKPDVVALKNEDKKQETKKQEKPAEEQSKQQEAALAPVPLPMKKPPVPRTPPKPVESQVPPREFNTDQIKELIDKRTPSRRVASGQELSSTSALGAPTGQSATLSMSEIDAFRARMRQCWNTTGIPNDQPVFVDIRVDLKPDGSLAREPQVTAGTAPPYGPVLARTAISALTRCQPFTMFRRETYNQWKSMDLTFRPQEFD